VPRVALRRAGPAELDTPAEKKNHREEPPQNDAREPRRRARRPNCGSRSPRRRFKTVEGLAQHLAVSPVTCSVKALAEAARVGEGAAPPRPTPRSGWLALCTSTFSIGTRSLRTRARPVFAPVWYWRIAGVFALRQLPSHRAGTPSVSASNAAWLGSILFGAPDAGGHDTRQDGRPVSQSQMHASQSWPPLKSTLPRPGMPRAPASAVYGPHNC
jgi:hypothetical protein